MKDLDEGRVYEYDTLDDFLKEIENEDYVQAHAVLASVRESSWTIIPTLFCMSFLAVLNSILHQWFHNATRILVSHRQYAIRQKEAKPHEMFLW